MVGRLVRLESIIDSSLVSLCHYISLVSKLVRKHIYHAS